MNSLELKFFNEPELICLHTVKWFQVLLYTFKAIHLEFVLFGCVC